MLLFRQTLTIATVALSGLSWGVFERLIKALYSAYPDGAAPLTFGDLSGLAPIDATAFVLSEAAAVVVHVALTCAWWIQVLSKQATLAARSVWILGILAFHFVYNSLGSWLQAGEETPSEASANMATLLKITFAVAAAVATVRWIAGIRPGRTKATADAPARH